MLNKMRDACGAARSMAYRETDRKIFIYGNLHTTCHLGSSGSKFVRSLVEKGAGNR